MCKKFLALLFVLGLLVVVSGCSSNKTATETPPANTGGKGPDTSGQSDAPKEAADPLQALYEKAKAEGEVIVWSPANPEELNPLIDPFKEKFPGIKITHSEVRSEDFVQRAIAESQQGKVSFDVGTGRLATDIPLLERDLLQGYDDWTELMPINPDGIYEDGKFLTWYNLLYPVSYNTTLVKPEDLPKTWEDLLDPKWKGKILLEKRAAGLAYIGLEWGEERMVDYLTKLKAQNPIFTSGGTGTAQQLIAGAGSIGIGPYVHNILQMKDEGAPIDWIREISPIGASTTVVLLLKNSPNPNAAKLFSAWLASDEAAKINIDDLYKGPIVKGGIYNVVQELEKNNVNVIREDASNYQKASELNELAMKTLGVSE